MVTLHYTTHTTELFEISFNSTITVSKIYTLIFSVFRKELSILRYQSWDWSQMNVVNIAIWELETVSNESSGNFTFYRGIYGFFTSFILNSVFCKKVLEFRIQVYRLYDLPKVSFIYKGVATEKRKISWYEVILFWLTIKCK